LLGVKLLLDKVAVKRKGKGRDHPEAKPLIGRAQVRQYISEDKHLGDIFHLLISSFPRTGATREKRSTTVG
jgi:hypothetical protein